MTIKKIQKEYVALLVVVCLIIGLTVSYKVFASELNNESMSFDDVAFGEQIVEDYVEYVSNDLVRSEIEPFIEEEKTVLPAPEIRVEADEEGKSEELETTVETKKAEKEKTTTEKKGKKKKGNKKEEKKVKNAFQVKMTKADLTNLYRLVQSEVGNMDEKSKLLVASVVLNRVNHSKFPNTVSGVVLQKLGNVYQFSPVAPGKRFWTCKVSPETKAAVDKVLKNGDYSKGSLYFVAKRYTNKGSWFDRNLAWIMNHGGQDYYKER